jgi:hypothetical protein
MTFCLCDILSQIGRIVSPPQKRTFTPKIEIKCHNDLSFLLDKASPTCEVSFLRKLRHLCPNRHVPFYPWVFLVYLRPTRNVTFHQSLFHLLPLTQYVTFLRKVLSVQVLPVPHVTVCPFYFWSQQNYRIYKQEKKPRQHYNFI